MEARVLLVDDHKIMRQGLRSLLEHQTQLKVVAEADEGAKALEEVTNNSCPLDLVIMDMVMPKLNGVEATREIIKRCPDVKVLALSMYGSERLVENIFKAGAKAYVLKSRAFPELIEAIDVVMQGGTYLSPELGGAMLIHAIEERQNYVQVERHTLTPREREVLQHLAEGKTAKEIAQLMNLSSKTIEFHRQRISEKLHLRSLADLIKYAIREGISPLD